MLGPRSRFASIFNSTQTFPLLSGLSSIRPLVATTTRATVHHVGFRKSSSALPLVRPFAKLLSVGSIDGPAFPFYFSRYCRRKTSKTSQEASVVPRRSLAVNVDNTLVPYCILYSNMKVDFAEDDRDLHCKMQRLVPDCYIVRVMRVGAALSSVEMELLKMKALNSYPADCVAVEAHQPNYSHGEPVECVSRLEKADWFNTAWLIRLDSVGDQPRRQVLLSPSQVREGISSLVPSKRYFYYPTGSHLSQMYLSLESADEKISRIWQLKTSLTDAEIQCIYKAQDEVSTFSRGLFQSSNSTQL